MFAFFSKRHYNITTEREKSKMANTRKKIKSINAKKKELSHKKWYEALCFLNAFLVTVVSLEIAGYCYFKKQDKVYQNRKLSLSPEQIRNIEIELEDELNIDIRRDELGDYIVLNAIKTNNKLTQEEKEIFYGLIGIIKDNPYLDKEYAYKVLNSIYVDYLIRPCNIEDDVMAIYNSEDNKICDFVSSEKSPKKEILGHEVIHAIFNNQYLPSWFKEGMTELYCNEYYAKDPYEERDSYPINVTVVKILCEISSPESVLEAFSNGNIYMIINDMPYDFKTKMKAFLIFEVLDKMFEELDSNNFTNIEKRLNLCLNFFDECIEKKYNEDDSFDLYPYTYNKSLLTCLELKDNYVLAYYSYLDSLGTMDKAYFSSELLEKNKKLCLK